LKREREREAAAPYNFLSKPSHKARARLVMTNWVISMKDWRYITRSDRKPTM